MILWNLIFSSCNILNILRLVLWFNCLCAACVGIRWGFKGRHTSLRTAVDNTNTNSLQRKSLQSNELNEGDSSVNICDAFEPSAGSEKAFEPALLSNILPLHGHYVHSTGPVFHTHAMNISPRKLVTLLRWNVNISRMDLLGSQLFPMAISCYCVEEFEEYNHC